MTGGSGNGWPDVIVVPPPPNWEGVKGTTVEHRTVGPARAWCYQDAEWCYSDPTMLCWCCDQIAVPIRWRGLGTAVVLADLYRNVRDMEHYVRESDERAYVPVDVMLKLIRSGGDDAQAP